MLPANLEPFSSGLKDYSELRVQENRSTVIALINGDVVSNSRLSSSGVSARVCRCGRWGFASNPELDEPSVEAVIRAANRNAELMAQRAPHKDTSFQTAPATGSLDLRTDKPRRTRRELITFLQEIDSYLEQNCPKIRSRQIGLVSLDMEKRLLTSYGSCSYSLRPRTNVYVRLAVDSSTGPVELLEVFGGRGQFEDVFEDPLQLHARLDEQYEHLLKKTEGVFPEAGVVEAVLDTELSGILAHEAIGHTTEADLVLGGSIAAHHLGREVASPLVNLVDFASSAYGQTVPIPVHIDDEGTAAVDTVIIEDGVLRRFMHNKESADRFDHSPSGHARAYQFSDEPLIRMRNTAFLPASSTLDEMIASIDRGYYLLKAGNGQADSTSEFMFAVPLGYEIRKGQLGRAIKDTTIGAIHFAQVVVRLMI
ncbi:TldD/PmbA family protein [Planctomycetota bacterium]